MAIPNQFLNTPESALASFNYEDIANATGVVHYYPIIAPEFSGASFISGATLIPSVIQSSSISESVSTNTNAATKHFEWGYDLKFNLPRVVRGDIFISAPWAAQANGADANNQASGQYIIYIQRVDASGAVTDIISGQSLIKGTPVGGTALFNATTTTKLPLITKTKFKKGVKLRALIQFWGSKTGGGHTFYIGHDPANTTDPLGKLTKTEADVYIPFVIDL